MPQRRRAPARARSKGLLMLRELAISSFAIIDDLQLQLAPGFTVLSGETGAGKSILLEAVGLLLGDRADAQSVRDGAKRAEVSAVFDVAPDSGAARWLAEQALDDPDGECVVRRVVSAEGRSRNWVNGSPVPARMLKALGEHLVDIHGQHEHQSLLRPANQRHLLDDSGDYQDTLQAVADLAREYRDTDTELQRLLGVDADGSSRLDLLRYQFNELEALELQAGEVDRIEAEHNRLAHAEQLIQDAQTALDLMYEGETAASSLLGQSQRLLDTAADIDAQFSPVAQSVASALIQIEEAADDLRRHLDRLELDPERLAWLSDRMATLQSLARKHRCDPEALPQKMADIEAELAGLEGSEARIEQLRAEQEKRLAAYGKRADALHDARVRCGRALAEQVTALIRELGMPEGEFVIDVRAKADARPSPAGHDDISFRVSANPGQTPRGIEKVASGGELSRISLGLQVAAISASGVPTLIFDEVDAGIGGGVAEIVGRLLRQLAAQRQNLCVTHLPQVAAQADHHLYVYKETDGKTTRTAIRELSAEERVDELARMLGGVKITERTLGHAREMLEQVGAA